MITSVNCLDAMKVAHENNLHENKHTALVAEPKTPAANSSWGNWLYEQASHLQKQVYDTNKPLGGWIRDQNESSAESYQEAVMGNHSYIEPTRNHTPSISVQDYINQTQAAKKAQQPSSEGFDIKIETPLLDAAQSAVDTVSNATQSAYNTVTQPITAAVINMKDSATAAAKKVVISTAKTAGQYALDAAGMQHIDINQDPAVLAGQIASHVALSSNYDPNFIGPKQLSFTQKVADNIDPKALDHIKSQSNTIARTQISTLQEQLTNPTVVDPNAQSWIEPATHETLGGFLNAGVGVAADKFATAAENYGKEPVPSNLPQERSPYAFNDIAREKLQNAKNATIDAAVKLSEKAVIDHFNPIEEALPDNIKKITDQNNKTIEEVLPSQKIQTAPRASAAQNQKLSTIVDVPTGDVFDNNMRLDIRDGALKAVYLGKELKAIAVTFDKTTGLYTATTKYSDANIDLDPLRVKNKLNKNITQQAIDLTGISGMSQDIASEIMKAAKPIEDNVLTISFDPTTNIVTQKLTKKSMSNEMGETGATITTTTSFNAILKTKQVAAISQQLIALFRGTRRYIFNGTKDVIFTVSNYMAKKFNLSAQETAAATKEISATEEQVGKDLAQSNSDVQFNAKFKNWINIISEQYINFIERANAVKNPSSALLITKTITIKGTLKDRFSPEITISSDAQTDKLQFATFQAENGKTYKLTPENVDESGIVTLSAQIEHKDAPAIEQLTTNLATIAFEKLVMDSALKGITISDLSHAYPGLKNAALDHYYGKYINGYDRIEIKYDLKNKTITTTVNQTMIDGKPDAQGNYNKKYVPKTIEYPMS